MPVKYLCTLVSNFDVSLHQSFLLNFRAAGVQPVMGRQVALCDALSHILALFEAGMIEDCKMA